MDDASLRYHSEMTVYFYIPECMHTQILTEIHRERKHEENEKIRSNMKSLEKNQDDNQKMYDAVRQLLLVVSSRGWSNNR